MRGGTSRNPWFAGDSTRQFIRSSEVVSFFGGFGREFYVTLYIGTKQILPEMTTDGADDPYRMHIDEARCALDHQIAKVKDIDDKALRTVRIAVVFLGVVLSVAQFRGARTFVNAWTLAGSSLLVASIGFGVLTYTVSEPDFGPGPNYIDRLLESDPDSNEWRVTLLEGFGDWMEHTRDVNVENARLLLVTQLCLILGVLLIGGGIALKL